jgi:hypothetical protein
VFPNCEAIVALAKEPNETVFQRTVGLNDPALTAIANAIRVGEHVAERLR